MTNTDKGKLTLIIVRITLTEPKAAFAGVILNASFARFMASMAVFKEERVPSRRLGRRDFVSMGKQVTAVKKATWHGGLEDGPKS